VNVIVDTSVWSLALRRAKRMDDAAPRELAELIREGRVVMLGPVRQELLSGIKQKAQFDMLREHLRAFPDLLLEMADYEDAASAFNRCRERGIQGSNTDFLICAAALRRELSIFTTDGDFRHFARVLKLALHEPRS
jgi:predicted nucleic acid-binding protein